MKILGRFIIIALFFLAACSQNPAPEQNTAPSGFSFDVNPAQELATLSAAPAQALTPQAVSGPRALAAGSELALQNVTYLFGADNTLTVTATFRNATTDTTLLPPFAFFPTTTGGGYLSSTEPTVTEADLGVDGLLVPGETTAPITFTVNHTGQSFTYVVSASATVETGCTGADAGRGNFNAVASCNALLGDLNIGDADARPATLPAFANLKTVTGDLSLSYLDVTSLTGFGALTSVGGRLEVREVQLDSATAFANLETVGGAVSLTSLGTGASVPAFPSLTRARALEIAFSDNLADIPGFGALTTLDDYIFIAGNASLTTITGLGALTSVGGRRSIIDNPLFDCSAPPQSGLGFLPVDESRLNLVDCPTR